jgi:uncharacterized protein YwgA
MDKPQFEVDDAIVFFLGCPSIKSSLTDQLEGITRLEKLIFLMERETELGEMLTESPEFKAHHFGPFSVKIYQAVETLVAAGIVDDSANPSLSPEDAWEYTHLVGDSESFTSRTFKLTERGRKYYLALIRELPIGAEDAATKFKARFGGLPLKQLVRYVYERYDEYTDKSIIRDKILGTR